MNGISWTIGTMPIEDVTFGFGVKLVCAITLPVVKLAIVPNSEDARMIIRTAPKISPTRGCDWTNVRNGWKSVVKTAEYGLRGITSVKRTSTIPAPKTLMNMMTTRLRWKKRGWLPVFGSLRLKAAWKVLFEQGVDHQ